jgi:E3 ubiquitin-protein ligase UBR7
LEEEETYEPPEDPDSGLSLEELGMRALQRLPRDRAIDGIRAFNDMRCVYNLSLSLLDI